MPYTGASSDFKTRRGRHSDLALLPPQAALNYRPLEQTEKFALWELNHPFTEVDGVWSPRRSDPVGT